MKRRATISLADIRNSACAGRNQHLFGDQHAKEKGKGKKGGKRTYKVGGRIVSKFYPTNSKEKDFIQQSLIDFCRLKCLHLFEEYTFTEERGWRFDWCIPALLVAFEYEGGIMNPNGDHRSIKGMNRDIQKYNRAQELGWKVHRFTTLNYEQLSERLKEL